jgi:hypothetical protein
VLAPLARYGFPILILLFFLPGGFGNTIVSSLLSPVQTSLSRLLYFGLI